MKEKLLKCGGSSSSLEAAAGDRHRRGENVYIAAYIEAVTKAATLDNHVIGEK